MKSGENSIFGLQELVDYDVTYNNLLKSLAGSTFAEDMSNQEL